MLVRFNPQRIERWQGQNLANVKINVKKTVRNARERWQGSKPCQR